MRILALDLSLVSTGWCLLGWSRDAGEGVPGPWVYESSGVIRQKAPTSPDDAIDRLTRISREILNLGGAAFSSAGGVSAAYIEDYAFSRHDAHAHALGELHGVVLADLRRAFVPVAKVGIGTWRKRVLGRGNLKKDEVRIELLKRYAMEFKSIDEAEAFGVAMYAYLEATAQNKPVAKPRRSREPSIVAS